MELTRFIELVRERAALETHEEAERATTACLRAVGELLLDLDAAVVATRLPPALAAALRGSPQHEDLDLDDFYERVSEYEHVPRALSLEHAQVVCQVLTEALDDDARRHLYLRVPESIGRLFVPRPPVPHTILPHAPASRQTPPGTGTTLATGRPGGHHPLSESGPAQRQSVVASENPHGDTKLSSSHGISTEREGDTLAAGRPGSKHPLSESGD